MHPQLFHLLFSPYFFLLYLALKLAFFPFTQSSQRRVLIEQPSVLADRKFTQRACCKLDLTPQTGTVLRVENRRQLRRGILHLLDVQQQTISLPLLHFHQCFRILTVATAVQRINNINQSNTAAVRTENFHLLV